MHGPIDYIIVEFQGNKFDGSILGAVSDAIDQGVIALVELSVVSKDANGVVTTIDIANIDGGLVTKLVQKNPDTKTDIDKDDLTEMSELMNNNSTAGLLVVEQLWAKPLKKALIDANGVLLAEGRIHPEAAAELETI